MCSRSAGVGPQEETMAKKPLSMGASCIQYQVSLFFFFFWGGGGASISLSISYPFFHIHLAKCKLLLIFPPVSITVFDAGVTGECRSWVDDDRRLMTRTVITYRIDTGIVITRNAIVRTHRKRYQAIPCSPNFSIFLF